MKRSLAAALSVGFSLAGITLGATACTNDREREQPGEAIEDGADEVKEAGKDVGRSVEDAGD